MTRRLVAALTIALAVFGGSLVGQTRSAAAEGMWVPTYVQQRNLSCEFAALTIATGAYGGWVDEWSFEASVGYDSNPHIGFRGDINGWWGNTWDYGVYPEALARALPDFGFSGEVLYGGSGTLTDRLDFGVPTLVWLGLWGDTGWYETDEFGATYKLVPGYHVMVAYGYDADGVYLSDPANGSYTFYDWGTFLWMWYAMDGMGLAVWPG
ncbi:MAG: Spore_germination_protein_YaaH [uncultured Thermomicrobiales bacterium]|uniref:Spore_germination_protein_YaaH n=1 Tax=uncultured Thermomicrobiales bacterium TaxID=1645740 RepID=A0A6J4V021_9BACT|nr:MAG: Spore_germination_protein_YaaH [uncultured Thermomicrobiales bacterium]